jgi:Di-haem oxidoreductase, putative peroxidase
MKSSRWMWNKMAALGGTLSLALWTFLALCLADAPVASAQPTCITTPPNQTPCWPANTGVAAVSEWYSDIPWAQRLGTYRGGEFLQAIMLPYIALPADNKNSCGNPTDLKAQARCMINTGVTSVFGFSRTDTPYKQTDLLITAAKRCNAVDPMGTGKCTVTPFTYCLGATQTPGAPAPSQACIQVMLQISGWSDQKTPSGVGLAKRTFGNDYQTPFNGVVITDSNSYAPQMPWYMSHYCDSLFDQATDSHDVVCYGDYISDMNTLLNNTGSGGTTNYTWPNSNAPVSVWPQEPAPPAASNHCAAALPDCTMVFAGFDLAVVSSDENAIGYFAMNRNLFNTANPPVAPDQCTTNFPQLNCSGWFNNALLNFPTFLGADDTLRHFPWSQAIAKEVTWGFLNPLAQSNPFLGSFTWSPAPTSCVTTRTGQTCAPNTRRADHFLYPRQCSLSDFPVTDDKTVAKLRNCAINYEVHFNGWINEWPQGYKFVDNGSNSATELPSSMNVNNYGRTTFLFAGVPGMQLPVSYYKSCDTCLSVYEQVHNSSVFSLYLPIANEADDRMAMGGRNYSAGNAEFSYDLLMQNHNEFKPGDFAEGIRGKVLWHNEYRSKIMFDAAINNDPPNFTQSFPTYTFPAAFIPTTKSAPYHNYQCDGCHVRNGSGIPINTANTLDVALQGPNPPAGQTCQINNSCFMNSTAYNPSFPRKEYLFSGTIKPMKLVFFDLNRRNISSSIYSNPAGALYANKIMNFHGDSFHVTKPSTQQGNSYTWSYQPIPLDGSGKPTSDALIEVVDTTLRTNPETGKTYQLWEVQLAPFTTAPCDQSQLNLPIPKGLTYIQWPQSCDEISNTKINDAINLAKKGPTPVGQPGPVGFMLLNGKRLGNLGAMEAIPNKAIAGSEWDPLDSTIPPGFRDKQIAALKAKGFADAVAKAMAGTIVWESGVRAGLDTKNFNPRSPDVKLTCNASAPTKDTCWIGRFGWLGDRVSLEDQVANAAFIEMSMSSTEGYNIVKQYMRPGTFPIRYYLPNCGLANKTCIDTSKNPIPNNSNVDLPESDIARMADYARWIGSPTRSEFTVSLQEVIDGEQEFRRLQCHLCHVIDKISITDANDTMMPLQFRERSAVAPPAKPFLSYLGTDLLMHDMGYLSQVGLFNDVGLRDANGVVTLNFSDFVQKIRTPALKGLRFNRFATGSFANTIGYAFPAPPVGNKPDPSPPHKPACDFLLHDGRACDAIEAAFLHDGPEIKALGVIGNLVNSKQIPALRAFLYSL